jgi:hypothetical protein
MFYYCSCEACDKAWPLVSLMPKDSMLINSSGMIKLMKAAKFDVANYDLMNIFGYYCEYSVPVDNKMLPKMVALLSELHKSGAKVNQWHYKMQECIKNHYRTQGIGFFFNDSKEILKGTKVFNVKRAISKSQEKFDNCIEIPGPFGLKFYI